MITPKHCRPGHVEVRWVPDNSGMRVGAKQAERKDMEDLEKMERRAMGEELEVGSMQSKDKQQNMEDMDNLEKIERGESMQSTDKTNMDEKKTMNKVEAKAKELELDRKEL